MDDWIGAVFWILILFGGLIVVPFAFRKRHDNRLRFRSVLWTTILYLAGQATLYIWIYGYMRPLSHDWLHALFLPMFLGLALPIIMAVVWFATTKRSAT